MSSSEFDVLTENLRACRALDANKLMGDKMSGDILNHIEELR